MSLTSLIKGKSEPAEKLQTILRSVLPKKGEFYTLSGKDPFSSSYTTRVPYELTNNHYPSVVGTAFDYMARLIVAQKLSNVEDEVWIDSTSEKGLAYLLVISPKSLHKRLQKKYEKGQKIAERFVKSQTEITDKLLDYSTYLARLEQIIRSGMPPQDIEGSLLSDEVDEIINELGKMCVVFESEFMVPEIMTSESDVVFNPHFGRSSQACGGADADIFIDGVLYDFKTTKKIGYAWQDIAQIFGYYFLNEIAGKMKDDVAMLHGKEIKKLAFYKARYGEFEIVNISDMDREKLERATADLAEVLQLKI